MTGKIKLTYRDIDNLINYRFDEELFEDRFEIIFDDIPFYHPDHTPSKGETHRDYLEDDGREYRIFTFKDNITNIEHTINYIYNSEFPNDFMDKDNTIEIVDNQEDSDFNL